MPPSGRQLLVRLLVCAHMGETRHRRRHLTGCGGTAFGSQWRRIRRTSSASVFCAEYKSAVTVPCPLARMMFGEEAGEVEHFEFLHIGESEVASAVYTLDGYKYDLVIEDDISGFVWLAAGKVCTANYTAEQPV